MAYSWDHYPFMTVMLVDTQHCVAVDLVITSEAKHFLKIASNDWNERWRLSLSQSGSQDHRPILKGPNKTLL